MEDELVLTVTSASGCMAVTTSAASTCAVRMLSSAQKASEPAMRRRIVQISAVQVAA